MQKQLYTFLFAGICTALAFAANVRAEDKSQYNLFNPVPESEMRSFSTDRPTKANSPYTVDAGHFQYEADIANWIYDHNNTSQTTVSNLLITDPVLKMGLTRNTDLELALAPININHSSNRVTGTKTSSFGFGDVFTRIKFNLLGNDGGDYALAIAPYAKAPTASRNIGNNHWEGGGYAPLSITLPQDWTLLLMTQVDFLQNAALDGTHINYQNLVNVSHPITNSLSGYAEFWSDVNTDKDARTQYTGDLGFGWLIRSDIQLDAGVNVGLNKAANDVQPYIGLSQRF